MRAVSGRLHAVLVARNEANRYLEAVLSHLYIGSIHLYDDCSEDQTAEMAKFHGALVTRRGTDVPSFLEHEGAFRQAAWEAFEHKMQPKDGDWVLALDCDEFLVAPGNRPLAVSRAIAAAHEMEGVVLPIPEVFGVDEDDLLVRVDGFWEGLSSPRLFRYRPDGKFLDRAMGCGSVPTYVTSGRLSHNNFGLAIAHVGYLDLKDRVEKHQRYSSMEHGHNPVHIDSILRVAVLKKWSVPGLRSWTGRL